MKNILITTTYDVDTFNALKIAADLIRHHKGSVVLLTVSDLSDSITELLFLSARSQYFKDGWGVYINPYITTSFGLTVMGSYWHSDKFLSFNGGGFYPSISEQRPERVDRQREIFMLRFLYDVKVADGLNFTLRAEPFYDTYSKAIEYSYGFYFNYYNRFFLLHARQSR
jgi:hypothetical protein